MANPELGTKQICPHCQAKFYDLGKRPAHCPKCATDFDPDEAVRSRRVRARAIVPDTDDEAEDQVAAKADDAEDEEEDDAVTPELDEVADEPPLATDDDEDTAEPGVSPVADDVPFLEEDEDDDFDDTEIDGLPEDGDTDDR